MMAAANGISSHGTHRAHERCRTGLSTTVRVLIEAMTAMTANAITTPISTYTIADWIAAVSSSGAGPRLRTAASAANVPTTVPAATAPDAPRATRTPSDHGDWPF